MLPQGALVPGRAYELRVGYGVRDLQGSELARPYAVGFTMSADLKSAWVGPDAVRFAIADGVTVVVEEGIFTGWTNLRVAERPVSPEPIPLPALGILAPAIVREGLGRDPLSRSSTMSTAPRPPPSGRRLDESWRLP